MTPSFAHILKISMALVLASALPAMAAPPPDAELTAAQQAVSRADSADGDQYAAQELAAARSELTQAQGAMAARKYKDALALSLAASADGDLAYAHRRAAQARTELVQRRSEIGELRHRLQIEEGAMRPGALDNDAPPAGDYAMRLQALATDPQLAPFAAFERLRAQQAVDALAKARGRKREAADYLVQRRVTIAELTARTESTRREIDQLDRERSELLVEASRRDAEAARAEAERLRVQAQIQAEEAERLRQQAAQSDLAMQDVEAAIAGVSDVQAAKLKAAREREAKLAREEAELVAGGKLPPSRWDERGEVFTFGGDIFAAGKATLTERGAASIRTLAAYLQATSGSAARIEGLDPKGTLAQQRAEAVREALVKAGASRQQVRAAVGSPAKSKPRVEVVISTK
jgi:outer membrane protein OmpA-like peptidoglycan-associated protein